MEMEFSPEALNDVCNIQGYSKQLFRACKFNSYDERKRALFSLGVSSGALSDDCVKVLYTNGFLSAPASTKYHGNYPGGLFDHSYNVATALVALTDNLNLKWSDPSSPVKIGLLHDLCKVDQYISDSETDLFKFNDNTLITGHGTKSVIIAQRLPDVKLNEEEIACILYHMGAFTEKEEWKHYTNAIHTYPNVLWTHTADMVASQIMEV